MAERQENPRLILDLYWGSADERTITAAAEFARLLGLELLGIYVEDEAVHALAGLPFAREFKLPAHEWGAIEADRIAAEFRYAAMRAQRMLARTADALGITSAFEVLRGDPTTSVTRRSRPGDIMVFAEPRVAAERSTRSFARLWQAALNSPAALLLVPSRLSQRRGPVAAVVTRRADPVPPTAARIAVAAGEDLLLLIPECGRSLAEEAIATAKSLGLAERRIRTRTLPVASTEGILHALADCPERMVVLDRTALTGSDEAIFALAARCGVPVLIVESREAARQAGATNTHRPMPR
jgi:hypothetical protein